MPATDEELMTQAAAGDPAAFAELAARYRGALTAYFAQRVGNAALAQDLTQEVFLKLWQARSRYAPLGRAASYLFTIARNHLYNELERRAREQGAGSLQHLTRELFARLPRAPGSDEVVLAEWRLAQMRAAITALPPRQREVFELSRLEGLRYAEIAARLGIAEGTVKAAMFAAVHRLRERLDGQLP